jgi:LytS/YehU family sensor histidine kinase
VRAYLDVEQARFGERLQFRIVAGPEAGSVRIPAMMLQTLVENAVKHGVSALSTAGIIDVHARVHKGRMQIEVRDSGPGFDEDVTGGQDQCGFGLRNIRERLQGYYGQEAWLRTGRDGTRNMTLVQLEMPCAQVIAETVPA